MKKFFKIFNINTKKLSKKMSNKSSNKNNNNKYLTAGVVYIHNHFQGEIKDLLPELLNSTRVVIYQCFNKSIDDLPDNITHISFAQYSKFNQPINKLPSNLLKLTFGCDSQFNSPINITNILNNNIDIYFNKKFNSSFDSISNNINKIEFQKDTQFNIDVFNINEYPKLLNVLIDNIVVYPINNDLNINNDNLNTQGNNAFDDTHINYKTLSYSFKNSKTRYYTPIPHVLTK